MALIVVYATSDPERHKWPCGCPDWIGPLVCDVCNVNLDTEHHAHLYRYGVGVASVCSEGCAIVGQTKFEGC